MTIDKGTRLEMDQMKKRIDEEKERQKWKRIAYVREYCREMRKTPEYRAKMRFKKQEKQMEIDLLKEENKELRKQIETLGFMIQNAEEEILRLEAKLL